MFLVTVHLYIDIITTGIVSRQCVSVPSSMSIIPICLNIHVTMTEVTSRQQHISPVQYIKSHI